ncbi:Holliday junction resolvase RuvX [candidate division KSB1 bacterium]
MKKRILAVDYGRKRMGVAVSDALGITAQSLPTLIIKNRKDALFQLRNLINEYNPERIVLGLPLDLHGRIGEMAKEVREFGEYIASEFAMKIDYLDERFTSKQAERVMHDLGEKTGKKKAKLDSLSAVFLLQGFLEMQSLRKGE